MAAGGGRGTGFAFSKEDEHDVIDDFALATLTTTHSQGGRQQNRILDDTESGDENRSEVSGSEISSSAASESENECVTQHGASGRRVALGADEIWSGSVSCVVGLQKRGLRGLMEGRKARERGQGLGRTGGGGVTAANEVVNGVPHSNSNPNANGNGVGLGIA